MTSISDDREVELNRLMGIYKALQKKDPNYELSSLMELLESG